MQILAYPGDRNFPTSERYFGQICIRMLTSLNAFYSPNNPFIQFRSFSSYNRFNMQFISFLLLAIHAATISSWKIPQGQPDGVYRVDANEDGTLNHTFLLPPTTSHIQSSIARSIHNPRAPISRIQRDLTFPESNTCQGYTLNADNNNAAFNGLSKICGEGIISATAKGTYSISGDVVVYWCNYPDQACNGCTPGQTCSATDASVSLQQYLTNACGSFVAGWTSWVREAYGQDSVSKNPGFCGNGLYG